MLRLRVLHQITNNNVPTLNGFFFVAVFSECMHAWHQFPFIAYRISTFYWTFDLPLKMTISQQASSINKRSCNVQKNIKKRASNAQCIECAVLLINDETCAYLFFRASNLLMILRILSCSAIAFRLLLNY